MSYIISNDSITLFHPHELKPYTFHRDDIPTDVFNKTMEVIETDIVTAIEILTPKKRLENFFARAGNVVIKGGVVLVDDMPMDNYAARKALDFAAEGLPFMPILQFIKRVQNNPSYRAVNELYGFLEAGQLPLTSDGYFLAYKKVRVTEGDKLVDIYTGKIDNSVGQRVSIPRNQVDEDPTRTCSHGLHVCSHAYLPHFGCGYYDKVVVVKVDPADVVAVPNDYNNAKMRVCAYEVMSILEGFTGDRNMWAGDSLNTEFDFNFIEVEVDEDEDESVRCEECGEELDYDGWNCLCGNCADREAQKAEPEDEAPSTTTGFFARLLR